MERVGVVGAGAAGLSAAWELASQGVAVTVFESRAVVGGRMRSDELDGAIVDVGVQLLSSTFEATHRLAGAVGAGDRVEASPGRDALWRNGRAHAVVYGSVASLAKSSALPVALKLKMAAKYLPFLASRTRGLDANDPAGTGGERWDGESIGAWGEAELGREFVELLAYPLLSAYYGTPPERTSAALYHALAKVGLDVRVEAVRGGMGAIPAAVAAAIAAKGGEVRTGVRATHVERQADRVEVAWDGGAEDFDAVVVATPAAAAAELIEGDSVRAWLGGVGAAPTVTMALLLDRPARVDWFGLSLPRNEGPGQRIVAACVQERKLAGLVPAGRGLVVALPAPSIAARLAVAEPQAVVDALMPALEEALPGITARVLRARTYAMPEGYTEFRPGHIRSIRRFDPSWLPPGIVLAGDYLVAPTVEGAVRSGRRAALSLMRGP